MRTRTDLMEPEFPLRRSELVAVLAYGAGLLRLGELAAELVRLEWPAQDAVELAELLSELRPDVARARRRGRAVS